MSYHNYFITVMIPDVQCDVCSLQLRQIVTDSLKPPDTTCTLPGTCPSVYHSCANVRIGGRVPRSQYTCAYPENWPYRSLASGVYASGENAAWTNGLLDGVPSQYRAVSGMCSADVAQGWLCGVCGRNAARQCARLTVCRTAMGIFRPPATPDGADSTATMIVGATLGGLFLASATGVALLAWWWRVTRAAGPTATAKDAGYGILLGPLGATAVKTSGPMERALGTAPGLVRGASDAGDDAGDDDNGDHDNDAEADEEDEGQSDRDGELVRGTAM